MIGGKVLDPSALVAYVQGSIAMDAWLVAATKAGIALYIPALAVREVHAVYCPTRGNQINGREVCSSAASIGAMPPARICHGGRHPEPG